MSGGIRSLSGPAVVALARLLSAWEKELAEHARALPKVVGPTRADQARADAHDAVDAWVGRLLQGDHHEEQRLDRMEASQAAAASAFEHHVRGLMAQAAAGYDVGLSLPGGGIVGIGGTSVAELSALTGLVLEGDEPIRERERESVLARLRVGGLPRPADLVAILGAVGCDAPWRARLERLAHDLGRLDARRRPGPAQLKVDTEMRRIGLLEELRSVLESYGPERLLELVVDPSAVAARGDLDKLPPEAEVPSDDLHARVDAVLDTLFFARRPAPS